VEVAEPDSPFRPQPIQETPIRVVEARGFSFRPRPFSLVPAGRRALVV